MKTNKVKTLIHRGTGGQQGWIYDADYLAPCIPACTYKDPIKIVVVSERNGDNENIRSGDRNVQENTSKG